jgi:PucR-like helix-turn-helix protein
MSDDLQDLVDDLSDLLGTPAVLEDTAFTLLAYSSLSSDTADPVRTESILGRTASSAVRSYFLEHGIASATGPVHIPGSPERSITARVCFPARSEGRTLGYLWVLEGPTRLSSAVLSQAAPLAERAGALLARRHQNADLHSRLVARLLSGSLDDARSAHEALVARGDLPSSGACALCLVRTPARPQPARVFPVLDPPLTDDALLPVARKVTRLVGAEGHAGVGSVVVLPASLSAADLTALRSSAAEADVAARVSLGRPHLGRVLTWPALGIYQLALQGAPLVEAVIRATPAHRLTSRAEPELVRTALTYLDEAGHAVRTASALGVHRQTLYYRLERIQTLTGIDLSQGEARLQLHLGLALTEILPYL